MSEERERLLRCENYKLSKMVILSKAFYVPASENFYQCIEEILKCEFGLVDAKNPDPNYVFPNGFKCLVWEDETGLGRYSVHCYAHFGASEPRVLQKVKGIKVDGFWFKYWLTPRRLSRKILEKDPMKPALERVLAEIKNCIDIPENSLEEEIDEVLEGVAAESSRKD